MTGARTWTSRSIVAEALLEAREHPPADYVPRDGARMVVVVGRASRGADAIAEQYARMWNWQVDPHPADWGGKDGVLAGFKRNEHMVSLGADVCLAFVMPCQDPKCRRPEPHMTHGTEDCSRRARKALIPVRYYTDRRSP